MSVLQLISDTLLKDSISSFFTPPTNIPDIILKPMVTIQVIPE